MSKSDPAPAEVSPLRILMIIPRYPPELGGAEQQAARLASSLRGRGHEVEVLTTGTGPDTGIEWDVAGTPVHRVLGGVPESNRYRLFPLAVCQKLLRDQVRTRLLRGPGFQAWDILHFHIVNSHVLLGAPFGKLLGYRTLAKIASAGIQGDVLRHVHPSKASRLHGAWARRVFRHGLDRIVALNPQVQEELMDLGVSSDTVTRIPNGIDLQRYQPSSPQEKVAIKARLGFGNGPVLIYTGGFRPEKSVPKVVDAFAAALPGVSEATLVLVGAGPEEAMIRERIRMHGLEKRVILTGQLEPDQVQTHLKAADGLVLLSQTEGLSNSLLEAFAVGLPAVVNDVPGNRVVLEQAVHGFLVPVDDTRAAGEAIVRLLGDPPLCERLGRAARARVEAEFSLESVALRYERLYLSLLGREEVASPQARC